MRGLSFVKSDATVTVEGVDVFEYRMIWRDGVWVETAPTECTNGHRLGPGRMIVAYNNNTPDGGRERTWECRQCGLKTFGRTVS